MDRLLALDQQYKKEVETNKIYKEQIIEYTSKINDLEKKVDIMTKSMMSSSCIASLGSTLNGSYDAESSASLATLGDDEVAHSGGAFMTEREYRLALWAARRWRYHQMTSLRVSLANLRFCFRKCVTKHFRVETGYKERNDLFLVA